MPKQIYPLRDFSGGLNSLKDPSDISDNEVSKAVNIMFTQQGAMDAAFNMKDSTNNKLSAVSTTHIDHIVAGYGLGYFETDHYADGAPRSLALVGNAANRGFRFTSDLEMKHMVKGKSDGNDRLNYNTGPVATVDDLTPSHTAWQASQSHGATAQTSTNGSGSGMTCSIATDGAGAATFTITASGDGYVINEEITFTDPGSTDNTAVLIVASLSNASAETALNLHNWFPTGTEISLSGMAMNYLSVVVNDGVIDGIYTVVGGNGSTEIYLDRATPAQIPSGLGGTGVADDLISVTGTITGIPSGDKILLVAHPDEHKIDVYSSSLAAYTEDAITLQDHLADNANSNVLYYKVDEAIRCCDTNIDTQGKIQWFGWISREHFVDSTSKATYSGYYANDNKLLPPTSAAAIKYYNASGDTLAYPPAGTGFTLKCFSSATDGLVPEATYEFAQSFIYDGNQESLLSHYGLNDATVISDQDTTLDHTDLKQLSIQIGAQGAYDERISGGRIYIRESGSDDEWTFLLDIDLSKGARTDLDGDYTSWKLAADDKHFIGASVTTYLNVNALSILNYEIINGYPSNIFSNDLGGNGEKWRDATVANNRVFVCNVRMADKSKGENKIEGHANQASLIHFPDKIMYSMPHRYDTFPEFNFIEAAKGDADSYMAIESYADRLLAFKRKSMDIINISGDPHNWFLEDTKNFMGVEHHAAVYKTQHGIVWVNSNGLYLYNGSQIVDLTENKIDDNTWYTFISINSIILYDEVKSMVYVIKNCVSDGDAYMIDLKRNNFTYLKDFAQDNITNPVSTNISSVGQILVGTDAGAGVDFYQFHRTEQEVQNVQFRTKELDFGIPNKQKKLYAVYITYKSSQDISSLIYYSINGGVTWVAFSSGSSATSSTIWQKGKWSLTTPVTSSKFMLELKTGATTATTVWINDISFEYRLMHKKDG